MMGGMRLMAPESEAAANAGHAAGDLTPPKEQHHQQQQQQQQGPFDDIDQAAGAGALPLAGSPVPPAAAAAPGAATNPKDAPPSTWRRDAHFMINHFKVLPCQRRTRHQWRSCPFVHPGEAVRRRSLQEVSYSAVMCAYVRLGQDCPSGEACTNAHNVFELWLHPARFRTQLCSDGTACRRSICFFAHGTHELRTPELSGAGGPAALDLAATAGGVGPAFAFDAAAAAAAQQLMLGGGRPMANGGGMAVHQLGSNGTQHQLLSAALMGNGAAAPYVTGTGGYMGPLPTAPPPLPAQLHGQPPHQPHNPQQHLVLAHDGATVPYLVGPAAAFGGNAGAGGVVQWAQLAAGGPDDQMLMRGGSGARLGGALAPSVVGGRDAAAGLWAAQGDEGFIPTTAPLQLMSLLQHPPAAATAAGGVPGQELLHSGSPPLGVLPPRMPGSAGALSAGQPWQQLPAVQQVGGVVPHAHNNAQPPMQPY